MSAAHDKKDTTIACVIKLPFYWKIASFSVFIEKHWLGVSFWVALNVLLVPKNSRHILVDSVREQW